MSVDSAIQYFQRPVVGHFDPAWSGTRAAKSQTQAATAAASSESLPNAAWRQSGTEVERIDYHGPPGHDDAEFSFADFLDVVNPLQHIPLVSSLYREMTGDQISGPAKIFGGALFGGPLGFASSVVEAVASEAAGDQISDSVVAAFLPDEEANPSATVSNPKSDAEAVPAASDASGNGRYPVPQAPERETVAAVLAKRQAAAPPDPPQIKPDGPAASPENILTGDAALGAFLTDLRGLGQEVAASGVAATSGPSREQPRSSGTAPSGPGIPLREQDWQGRINSNPPRPATIAVSGPAAVTLAGSGLTQDPINEGEFSQQMMMALDKYEALAKTRYNAAQDEYDDASADGPRP